MLLRYKNIGDRKDCLRDGGVMVEWFGLRTCEQQVPGSNPGRGGCALGQGTLSSLSSLSEET